MADTEPVLIEDCFKTTDEELCLELLKRLYEKGGDVDIERRMDVLMRNSIGANPTPLLFAADKSMPSVVTFLISKGADVTKTDSEGHTALHVFLQAIQFEDEQEFECIQLLIKAGVDVNKVTNDMSTALYLTTLKDHKRIFKELIQNKKCDVNVICGDSTVLMQVIEYDCECGNYYAEELIRLCSDVNIPNSEGITPLMAAVAYHNISIMRLLLAHDADVNVRDNFNRTAACFFPFCHSTYNSFSPETRLETLQLLIDNGAQLFQDCKEDSILHNAFNVDEILTTAGEFQMLTFLLNFNPDVNCLDENGENLLHFAVCSRDFNDYDNFIRMGVKIDRPNNFGNTPLHIACSLRRFDIVKMLIHQNCDVNIQDNKGNTPLHSCLQDIHSLHSSAKGYLSRIIMREKFSRKKHCGDIVGVLLSAGADVNVQNHHGNTPLMLALYLEESNVFRELLNYNAEVNLVNKEGASAFMIACRLDKFVAVKALLAAGSDIFIIDNSGMSSFEQVNCIKLILQVINGSDVDIPDDEVKNFIQLVSAFSSNTTLISDLKYYFLRNCFTLCSPISFNDVQQRRRDEFIRVGKYLFKSGIVSPEMCYHMLRTSPELKTQFVKYHNSMSLTVLCRCVIRRHFRLELLDWDIPFPVTEYLQLSEHLESGNARIDEFLLECLLSDECGYFEKPLPVSINYDDIEEDFDLEYLHYMDGQFGLAELLPFDNMGYAPLCGGQQKP